MQQKARHMMRWHAGRSKGGIIYNKYYNYRKDRVNITGKMEVTQIVQEIFPEDAKAAQISDIVVFKM